MRRFNCTYLLAPLLLLLLQSAMNSTILARAAQGLRQQLAVARTRGPSHSVSPTADNATGSGG
jgi:hypothetical protein